MSVTVVPYAITTTAKVKLFLGISSSSDDAVIDQIVNYVTDMIESYCGRRFLKTTYTNEVYDTNNQNRIFLKQLPVCALTTVEYRSGGVVNPTWNTYIAEGYLLYAKEGYVYFFSKLPKVMQGLRFTYDAGFLIDFTTEGSATHTLPLDITGVATQIAAAIHDRRKSQGVKMLMTEGQRVEFTDNVDDLMKQHSNILKKYQVHRFML